jgi:hypothetical protein
MENMEYSKFDRWESVSGYAIRRLSLTHTHHRFLSIEVLLRTSLNMG